MSGVFDINSQSGDVVFEMRFYEDSGKFSNFNFLLPFSTSLFSRILSIIDVWFSMFVMRTRAESVRKVWVAGAVIVVTVAEGVKNWELCFLMP